MKKIVLSLLTAAFLTGCSGAAEEDQNTNTSTDTTDATQNSLDTSSSISNEEVSEGVSEEDTAPASEEEIANSSTISDFTDYEELAAQDHFNPEEYEAHLITDNPGTRVFIFRDGEQQAYKTVFIKQDNRLKVIDIANNELLMNEQIR